ncbi:AsmA family protein [Devosia sp. PTR5]|uniref:AsmA family protein n=1 Tax=Devosia oryzisoli TaxID=2774138 RepID=A0A927FS71_9HYPH|nr:AsmA family protein [Devosia oryzisoli]
MLNRIYIVVGMLAIVVLAAAFIVPRFIQWSDYRDRMELLASNVLGADVTIGGDIEFSLLPQPRLTFSDVVVGDPERPAATVGDVEAEFALIDFLRDTYTVTSLVLRDPVIDLSIDDNGLFGSDVTMAAATSGVALENARIERGTIRLADQRSGQRLAATNIDGELRLSSFVGPFAFQGYADADGQRLEVRFNSGSVDSQGSTRVTSYLREANNGFSFTTDGMLTTGQAPKFDGTLVYRQSPPASDNADDIRGDLVFETKVEASTDRVVLSGYTLQPDENRASLRLTGSANIRVGANPEFDAVVSGGVFSLPPRPATEIPAQLPYEAVRLLAELPPPPLPPIKGKLGIDLAEVNLRGFALRNVRLEATTDGSAWTIQQALAALPGETRLQVSGQLESDGERPSFRGEAKLSSERLDALAQLWRKPQEDNPLFNMPATLTGRVTLAGDAFGFNDGVLVLDQTTHGIEVRLGYGLEPRLDVVGHFGDLDALHAQALLALVPNVPQEPSFGISFPEGSFSLTSTKTDLLGLDAHNFIAEGQWTPSAVRLSRLATSDWGGLSLNSTVRVGGTLATPHITGSGKFGVTGADAPGLDALYEMAAVPFDWQQALARSWPAEVQVVLDNDGDAGAQILTINGTTAGSALDLRAELAGGLETLATGQLQLVASLEAESGSNLLTQLSLGDVPLFVDETGLLATARFDGNPADGFTGQATLSAGEEMLGYQGSLKLAESGALSGEGSLEAHLQKGDGLAALAGLGGAGLGGFDATASVIFDDKGAATLEPITGQAGDLAFTGKLALDPRGDVPAIAGALAFDALDVSEIARMLFGSAALVGSGSGVWPEGPLAASEEPRMTRGTVSISGKALAIGGREVGQATEFDLDWTPRSIGLGRFQTAVGGGTISGSVEQCCAGALEDRTVSGRVTLTDVDVDAILPPAARQGLDGAVDAGLRFEATGNSLADIARAMTGEGNFVVSDFHVGGLDGDVYPAVAGLNDVLNTDAATLESFIGVALGQGDFVAPEARGAFSIAAGAARLANLIVEGEGALLSGSLNLTLETLGLDGEFVLTPLDFVDEGGLVQPETARIINRISGTLTEPQTTLDLAEIVAAVQVRANEIELDRLEQLRLADEARQREAAEARNKLIEEQKRQAAEAAAQRAAEEEAQRRAEEEARQQAQPPAPPPANTDPVTEPAPPGQTFDFSLPPINQPTGPGVNQPLPTLPGATR